MMIENLQLQELNFTLLTQSFNPTILTLNTLQNGGVIQPDWKLAEDPIYTDNGIKLVFTNHVRIIAQPNRIIFAETIGRKRLQDIWLPKIITNHVRAFPNIEYQAVSINPSGYVRFDSELEACKYMSEGLLASTPWQKFQGQSIGAVGLKLSYPYKSGNFYLDINQANIEVSGKEIAAVWFAGNFSHQFIGNNKLQKRSVLKSILQAWETDIKNFQDFINNEFLVVFIMPSVSVFPPN